MHILTVVKWKNKIVYISLMTFLWQHLILSTCALDFTKYKYKAILQTRHIYMLSTLIILRYGINWQMKDKIPSECLMKLFVGLAPRWEIGSLMSWANLVWRTQKILRFCRTFLFSDRVPFAVIPRNKNTARICRKNKIGKTHKNVVGTHCTSLHP